VSSLFCRVLNVECGAIRTRNPSAGGLRVFRYKHLRPDSPARRINISCPPRSSGRESSDAQPLEDRSLADYDSRKPSCYPVGGCARRRTCPHRSGVSAGPCCSQRVRGFSRLPSRSIQAVSLDSTTIPSVPRPRGIDAYWLVSKLDSIPGWGSAARLVADSVGEYQPGFAGRP
jgi:hypothetical protein